MAQKVSFKRAVFERACRACAPESGGSEKTLRQHIESILDSLVDLTGKGGAVSSHSSNGHSTSYFGPGTGVSTREEATALWQDFLDMVTEYEPTCPTNALLKTAILNDDRMNAASSYTTDFSNYGTWQTS